ncbi:MAG TPA: malto-oligosyltrehalose trehalohydrolase [Candidatus Udaeobacter sp.]|nr:malto-oligosyltrehalose trehalohydrolase [Candidatus Udaeobacter sp.]
MHRFDVWAPGRGGVDVLVDGHRFAMTVGPGDWWHAEVAAAATGSRYGFSLEGGEARPDPRSMSQPDGVLALSEVVDHSAYRWSDAGWHGVPLPGLVIYELHTGTFSRAGTFDGAIEHLPHLVELGVDAVELMPVAEFSGNRGWGYDGVDLFAPHHAYGGPAGLKRLVDRCHGAGLAVILDVVYNHLGPAGNFLPEFGPYLSRRHRTFWGAGVNFDGPGSDEVRRFVIDNATMWIRDYHIDGLRLDAVHAIVDDSQVHVLEELAAHVKACGHEMHRSTFVIAESDLNEPRLVHAREAGGFGLDAAWADDWHHALHTVLTGESAGYYEDFGSFEQLAKALRQAWVYDGERSRRRGRVRGGSPAGLTPDRFVVATQTHDQTGNRAAGERLAGLVSPRKLKIAAALLLTTPFTPMLFQGEEWAAATPFLYFTDHADADLGRAVTEGRRREFKDFGWQPDHVSDPQDPATFERSKLRWSELARSWHREMLEWYRGLLDLRRTWPAPRGAVDDEVEVAADVDACHLVFKRPGVTVRVNLGAVDWRCKVFGGESLILASDPGIACDGRGAKLPPESVALFKTGTAGA